MDEYEGEELKKNGDRKEGAISLLVFFFLSFCVPISV